MVTRAAKLSGRELRIMSLGHDKDFHHRSYAMLRRLESCVKEGTPLQEGDWGLLLEYLAIIARERKSVAALEAGWDALRDFFAPDTAKWNPSKGPIERYFERVVDQVCRLQAAEARAEEKPFE